MTPFKTQAFVQSLNVGKMQSDTMDEITILEERQDTNRGKYYIAEYKGVKCTAIFNGFNCCYYADDVYGRITE